MYKEMIDVSKFLVNEANECLLCKKPSCRTNCPVHTDIPGIINLFKEGKMEEAGEILFENNPMSAICAMVCPHEDQCFGHCIKGIKKDPVEFYKIEEFISREFLKTGKITIKEEPKNQRVAVVGSGPAGLTIATELVRKGYKVTVFEKNGRVGGILRYGIPDFRLPREIVKDMIRMLEEAGVVFRTNTAIGQVITIDKLFYDGYDAVFIGTGTWSPKRLDIKGETLGNSLYAINYLRSPKRYNLGKKVIVIGAGNVAMDAARSAKRYGADEVTIAYRKDFCDMKACKAEIEETKEDGVIFDTYKAPIEITEEGVIFADTHRVKGEDGRESVVMIEGSEKLYECDSVLIAISQTARNTIVKNNPELEVNKWGLLVTDEYGETTREGVFSGGDVTSGPSTVIEAVVNSKKAAESIDRYLTSKRK